MTFANDMRLSRRTILQVSAAVGALGSSVPFSSTAASLPSRPEGFISDLREQTFDAGWHFRRGDGAAFAATTFDHGNWRRLDLPHDWSIEDLPDSDPALNGLIGDADTAPLWQKVNKATRLVGPFDARLNDNQAFAHSASGGPTAYTVGGVGHNPVKNRAEG